MSISVRFLFYLLIIFNVNLFSQGRILTFQKIDPNPFISDSLPVKIAILPVDNQDSLLSENLYLSMINQQIILNKFMICPYSSLLQSKKSLRIKNLSSADFDCIGILNESLNIEYIISVHTVPNGMQLDLKNTAYGNLEFSDIYMDTDSSTAIKDLLKFFTDGLKAVYLEKGILNIIGSPKDATLNINGFKYSIPFSDTLDPGNYFITVAKEGYVPIKEPILLEAGKTVYKNYSLDSAFGKIRIDLSPENTSYIIRRELDSIFVRDGIGDMPLIELTEGRYLFEFKALGFTTQNRLFLVKANEILEEIIPLDRSFYPIEKITSSEPTVAYGLKIFASEWEYEIQYDLSGSTGKTYDVMLYLLDKNHSGQKFKIYNLSGDVGDDIKVGLGKKIFWKNIQSKFVPQSPEMLKFSFYLEID